MSTDGATVTAEYPPWIQYIVDHHTETVGCWFLGGIGDIMMQGAIIVMTAEYFSRSRRDPLYLRMVVLGLSVVNMLKTIQTIAVLWYKLVWGFGDYISASGSTWYSSSIVITAQFICTGVQVFFTHRLGRLLHWKGFWWILAPLVLAILMGVGGAIALTVAVFAEPGVVAMANFERIIIIQLTGNLASDTFVTFLTSAYLVLSRTGIERTDSLIQRLLRLTWLTALPPTICAALHLATYVELSASGNSLWVVFSFWAPKLYTISMLYTLNARGTLFNEDSYIMTSRILSVPMTSDLQFANPDSRGRNTGMPTGAAAESSLCELSKVGPMSSTIDSSVEGADRHSLKDDLHSAEIDSPRETRFSAGHVSTDGGSRRTAVHSLVDTGKRSSGVGDAASQHVSFHTPSKS